MTTRLRNFWKRFSSSREGGRTALCLMLLLFVAGCQDLPGKPDPGKRPISPRDVLDFDSLYQRSCAGCHGRDGRLGPAPPLNDPLFLAIVPDAELLKIVHDGRHGTLMPGFAEPIGGTLTDEQIKVLAIGLKPKWRGKPVETASLPPYAGATGDALNGAKLFVTACAPCHGPQGKGATAGALKEDFLMLVSDQALRRFIITGRPDLGMPSYADNKGRGAAFQPLTSAQIDDLVAHLAVWRKGNARPPASTKTND